MQQNPYDFIMQSPNQPKKAILGGDSKKARILKVLIIGGVALVLILIISSFVSKIGQGKNLNLYKLAAAQEDLISITSLNTEGQVGENTAIKAATLNIVITSQNKEVRSAIAKTKVKDSAKNIALYKVSSYKKVLDDSKVKGTYGDAYTTLLANRIDDYRVKLQTAYTTSQGAFKTRLENFYQQINTISPPPAKATATPTPATTEAEN